MKCVFSNCHNYLNYSCSYNHFQQWRHCGNFWFQTSKVLFCTRGELIRLVYERTVVVSIHLNWFRSLPANKKEQLRWRQWHIHLVRTRRSHNKNSTSVYNARTLVGMRKIAIWSLCLNRWQIKGKFSKAKQLRQRMTPPA